MCQAVCLLQKEDIKNFGERDYMSGSLEDFKGEIGYKR